MKINSEIKQVKKITDYNYFLIINDNYLYIKEDNYIKLYKSFLKNISKDVLYDDDSIKKIYENIAKDMDSIFSYYYDMQDKIEEMLYPSESFYILIINISKIYHLVDLGRYFLDRAIKCNNNVIRKIPKFENRCRRIDEKDYKYVVSILNDEYHKNNININDIDFFDLFEDEICFFLSISSLIPKIDGYNKNEVINLVNYVDRTYNYMLKKYEKYQKSDEENFKNKNNDIEFSSNE